MSRKVFNCLLKIYWKPGKVLETQQFALNLTKITFRQRKLYYLYIVNVMIYMGTKWILVLLCSIKGYDLCMSSLVAGTLSQRDTSCYFLFIMSSKGIMMTSSHGNIFRIIGPMCKESTGRRWIPHTKASDTKLWCFLWSAPELTVEYTIVSLGICDAVMLIIMSL